MAEQLQGPALPPVHELFERPSYSGRWVNGWMDRQTDVCKYVRKRLRKWWIDKCMDKYSSRNAFKIHFAIYMYVTGLDLCKKKKKVKLFLRLI
jgi:hypothetical protein